MPVKKLKVLKKAAEIVEINSRLAMISDFHAAFSANREHIDNLVNIKRELEGPIIITPELVDENWEDRLKKWQR